MADGVPQWPTTEFVLIGLVAVCVGKRVVTIRNCGFTGALRILANPTPSVCCYSGCAFALAPVFLLVGLFAVVLAVKR